MISKRATKSFEEFKEAGMQLGHLKGPGKNKLDIHHPEIAAFLDNGTTKINKIAKHGSTGKLTSLAVKKSVVLQGN